jgi:hypothetical protein
MVVVEEHVGQILCRTPSGRYFLDVIRDGRFANGSTYEVEQELSPMTDNHARRWLRQGGVELFTLDPFNGC